MRGYYPQRFDIIPGAVIRQVASLCKAGDCKFAVNTNSTTLMGRSGWYDKTGYFHCEDRNRRTDLITCIEHNQQWEVISTGTDILKCVDTTDENPDVL